MSNLTILAQPIAVCRLHPNEGIPSWFPKDGFTAIVRTPEELSLVCGDIYVPSHVIVEKGWRILKVQGLLEFSQVGVLAAIASPLAQAGISIFVISTYDTDYILVKETSLRLTINVLHDAGHIIEDV